METPPTTPILIRIQEALTILVAPLIEVESTNTEWTREIKKRMVSLGQNLGFYTCASGVSDRTVCHWGEWLYDVAWVKYRKQEGTETGFDVNDFHGVALALESEWGDKRDVRDDFQKLVQAKADYKVMIWDRFSGFGDRKELESMEETARHDPKNNGETYLFACYFRRERCFEFSVLSF